MNDHIWVHKSHVSMLFISPTHQLLCFVVNVRFLTNEIMTGDCLTTVSLTYDNLMGESLTDDCLMAFWQVIILLNANSISFSNDFVLPIGRNVLKFNILSNCVKILTKKNSFFLLRETLITLNIWRLKREFQQFTGRRVSFWLFVKWEKK